jgi:penicillin G amidase
VRALRYGGALLALLILVALLGAYLCLRGSLPRLEGELRVAGLAAPVQITRDARGVPTLTASNRTDLAWATGFVHAQDRFFEMDLSRRLAAGELSELVGKAALEQDRRARLFRFRALAREVLAQASPEQRAAFAAYTQGVNAGLATLRSRPWEYWVLAQQPAAWREEDGLLVVYAMWWDLQAGGFTRGIQRLTVNARLGGPQCEGGWKCALYFLYPRGTAWDAPDVSTPELSAVPAPIPGADALDVRAARAVAMRELLPARAPLPGSNNWAVAGRLTATGAALIANDMHLNQRVPTIWYHARLRVAGAGTDQLDLNGVTLPGAPVLVAGSNGHIAWGFTNSAGDWLDVERLDCTAVDEQGLSGTAGTVPLTQTAEVIQVHGAQPVTEMVRTGAAGVLLRVDPDTRSCWFGAWLAQLPEATNLNLMRFERFTSVDEALLAAPELGIPHENLVVGDRAGHIGWAIAGRIPAQTGVGRARAVPQWTTAADHPHIEDPLIGRLWTANARVASDDAQQRLIGGPTAQLGAEYDLGARASQVRDDLLALNTPATPADMLRIQLDDRALFLTRWQRLLLEVLDEASLQGQPRRAQFRSLVAAWDARAGVDSVGYRLVRAFHERVTQSVWDSILGALAVPAEDDAGPPEQFEGPLWQLLTDRPLHLLARPYADWNEFLRAQVDQTLSDLAKSCARLTECTWGRRNLVRIRHPLSAALPWGARFLDMPGVELPGDHNLPRVQDGPFGASERFAVSPGHEEEAYFELPGGQSGHPLSPYYRAGFMGWVEGRPLPFLPGPTEHTLTLTPR